MFESIRIKQLIEIFFTFFKIGCFTFGGGYAMIPLIEREIIVKKKWVKEEDVIDIFAVSESIPGAIAINSSTFVGHKIAGGKGAIAAMVGVVMPSFIIITLIATFFSRFQDNEIVKRAFLGIRAAVVALIIMAAIKIGRTAIKGIITVITTIITVILVLVLNIHAIYVILISGLLGMIVYYLFPGNVDKLIKEENDVNDIN